MPRYGQPVDYNPTFDAWWKVNQGLFQKELDRRIRSFELLGEPTYLPGFIQQTIDDLKTDVYREGYSAIPANVLIQPDGKRLIKSPHTNAAVATAAWPTNPSGKPDPDLANNLVLANNSDDVASKLALQYENRNQQLNSDEKKSENEDGYFLTFQAEAQDLSSTQIRFLLLKTFMEIAYEADKRQFTEGAVLSLVFVGTDGIYVLNVGDAPVYLTEFDDEHPENDKTSVISRRHDAEDPLERQHAISLGAVICDNTGRKIAMNDFGYPINQDGSINMNLLSEQKSMRISGAQLSRSIGDWCQQAFTVRGVSSLPTLTHIPFQKPDGTKLDPNQLHITACSKGISDVYHPEDITTFARKARDQKTNHISTSLVNSAHAKTEYDVTSIDVALKPGTLACVIDGHGITHKLNMNKAVGLVEVNFLNLFKDNTQQIKRAFVPDEQNQMVFSDELFLSKPEPVPEPKKQVKPPKQTAVATLMLGTRSRPNKAAAAKHAQNVNGHSSGPTKPKPKK